MAIVLVVKELKVLLDLLDRKVLRVHLVEVDRKKNIAIPMIRVLQRRSG
jgi:hypothetical protein